MNEYLATQVDTSVLSNRSELFMFYLVWTFARKVKLNMDWLISTFYGLSIQ